jgi:hypothetical protein
MQRSGIEVEWMEGFREEIAIAGVGIWRPRAPPWWVVRRLDVENFVLV